MEPAAGTHSQARVEVEAARRASRSADIAGTIAGLVLLLPGVLWLAYHGIFVASVTGQCDVNDCNDGAIAVGIGTAIIGPLVVWVVALIVAIVFLATDRRAWWMPLSAWWIPPAAFGVAIVVLLAGAGIAHWGAGLLF